MKYKELFEGLRNLDESTAEEMKQKLTDAGINPEQYAKDKNAPTDEEIISAYEFFKEKGDVKESILVEGDLKVSGKYKVKDGKIGQVYVQCVDKKSKQKGSFIGNEYGEAISPVFPDTKALIDWAHIDGNIVEEGLMTGEYESRAKESVDQDFRAQTADFGDLHESLKSINEDLVCPKCGGTHIDKGEGHKLNKCLSCNTAFDNPDESE